VLNAALDTPPPGLDESPARALVERGLQRAHKAGCDALVRELVERGAEAVEVAKERENEQRAEAGRRERRQREAALRDQYGPDLAERIELDGTYALLRYRGRLFAARDRIVASIDLPAVRGLRTQLVKRKTGRLAASGPRVRARGGRRVRASGAARGVPPGGQRALARRHREVLAGVAQEAEEMRAHLEPRDGQLYGGEPRNGRTAD
jgi:hypothetical protein